MDRGTNASMTGEQRADLERIAFGRTHTPEDEDAAAAARKELAEADRAAEVGVRPVRRARKIVASQEAGAGSWSLVPTLPDDGLLPPPPPEVPRKAVRRIHTAWLVPIIAGSIAAGYFGATMAVAGALQRAGDSNSIPLRQTGHRAAVAHAGTACGSHASGPRTWEPERGGCVV